MSYKSFLNRFERLLSLPAKTLLSEKGFLFMCYVYILYSASHNRYYIGQTNDPEYRLIRHNSGFEKSTSPYKPWQKVLVIEKSSRSEAITLERKLKNLNTMNLKRFIEKYK